MDPKEVQRIGAAMVSAADMSQEAVNFVLDEFVSTLKNQTSLGLGTSDYVEDVLRRALGEDKAASVMGRILPGQASKGLDILNGWMPEQSRIWSGTNTRKSSRLSFPSLSLRLRPTSCSFYLKPSGLRLCSGGSTGDRSTRCYA